MQALLRGRCTEKEKQITTNECDKFVQEIEVAPTRYGNVYDALWGKCTQENGENAIVET